MSTIGTPSSRIAFGPVPSRRLGRSLGINHVQPKACSYSCCYCQVGRTPRLRAQRDTFYSPAEVVARVRERVASLVAAGEEVDYLTFVPDGEPTLDVHLGEEIRALRSLGIPIAVITNGSLLSRPDVRDELCEADWVSVKVDTGHEAIWRGVNRPHGRLRWRDLVEGMHAFASAYRGVLVTETMLLGGLNDRESEVHDTAELVGSLSPAIAYLAVPTRPPAEPWARAAGDEAVVRAYEVFRAWQPKVELMLEEPDDAFVAVGDIRADLLAITAVHPMREAAVRRLLQRVGATWTVVTELTAGGHLAEVRYGPNRYFVRPVGRSDA
ncbi:MAG: radical SAM protein [Gemmatimonadota bacterium]